MSARSMCAAATLAAFGTGPGACIAEPARHDASAATDADADASSPDGSDGAVDARDDSDDRDDHTPHDARTDEAADDRCGRDDDCPAPTSACLVAVCDDGVCRQVGRVCDDGNDCSDDACDPAIGCVATPKRVGAPCVAGEGAEGCRGDLYDLPDVCDDKGVCRDNGVQDCAAERGEACARIGCVVTSAGAGCDLVPRADGLACSADGRSDECLDGALHGADVCVAGECVDAGAVVCPTDFCEAPRCALDGGCARAPIGVERDVAGTWFMYEMFASGSGSAARVASVTTALELARDGTITTYGAQASVAQPPPGDGTYCVTPDGDLHFALPYGAIAPAPFRVYRGALSGNDGVALVFREAEASVGIMMRLPTKAPPLSGMYRLVGLMRRDVIGVRALHGELDVDAAGCVRGGWVRSSDAREAIEVPPGQCFGAFVWLSSLRLELGADEVYQLHGTATADGDLVALARSVDENTIDDGLVLLMRERDDAPSFAGRHLFATLAVEDDAVTAVTRGEAATDGSGPYTSYLETSLDGAQLIGVGEIVASGDFARGYRERSGQPLGEGRVRLGHCADVVLGRAGLVADLRVPEATALEREASPEGATLRIGVIRP